MNDNVTAQKIIADNKYAVLATASLKGAPWISPVFFAYDSEYNIYWISNKDSLHSKLLRENPQVAIVIFDSQAPEGEGDGVYIKATVTELSEKPDVELGMKIFNGRSAKDEFRVNDASKVVGDGVWRIYKAVPQEVSKLTDGESIRGQYVDRRTRVSLS